MACRVRNDRGSEGLHGLSKQTLNNVRGAEAYFGGTVIVSIVPNVIDELCMAGSNGARLQENEGWPRNGGIIRGQSSAGKMAVGWRPSLSAATQRPES
jgi:hypothetical protein